MSYTIYDSGNNSDFCEDDLVLNNSVNSEKIFINENVILELESLLYSIEFGCNREESFKISSFELFCYALLFISINKVDDFFIKFIFNNMLASFGMSYFLSKNVRDENFISDSEYISMISRIIEMKKHENIELKENDIDLISIDGDNFIKIDYEREVTRIKNILRLYRRGDITSSDVYELLNLKFEDCLKLCKKKTLR